MIIATWNVNSITVRLPQVIDWLEKNRPDILCIQETKVTDEKFPLKSFLEAGYSCQFFGEKAYNGVAIASRQEADMVQKGFPDETSSDAKRFLEARFGQLSVLNVYIPNGQEVGTTKYLYKLEWMKRLLHHLQDSHSPKQQIVLCGDFNIAPADQDVYDPVALAGQILLSPDERLQLESIRKWGFVDTFRQHHSETGHFSWWDYRAMAFRRKMGLRIDHIWATESMAKVCNRSWIDVAPRKLEKPSDHAVVVSDFDLK